MHNLVVLFIFKKSKYQDTCYLPHQFYKMILYLWVYVLCCIQVFRLLVNVFYTICTYSAFSQHSRYILLETFLTIFPLIYRLLLLLWNRQNICYLFSLMLILYGLFPHLHLFQSIFILFVAFFPHHIKIYQIVYLISQFVSFLKMIFISLCSFTNINFIKILQFSSYHIRFVYFLGLISILLKMLLMLIFLYNWQSNRNQVVYMQPLCVSLIC